MKMYKHFILAILAIIGVLAPCAVEVNLNRTYVQEAIEYIDLAIEVAEYDVVEIAARPSAKPEKEEEGESVEDAIQTKKKHHTSNVLTFEKRRTYQFYGRGAGGLAAPTTLLAS